MESVLVGGSITSLIDKVLIEVVMNKKVMFRLKRQRREPMIREMMRSI